MDTRLEETLYPDLLKEIHEPPKRLHARGKWPDKDTKYLAVIGSSALTPYGRAACTELIESLKGCPISIVSGLSLGSDVCAHKAALSAGLHSIAVVPSGVDKESLYPEANKALGEFIVSSGGLLLSQHEDGHTPSPFDIRSKQRILVGISHAVLLIEAEEKSGALVAARLTHEYNRDLMCLPHRSTDPHGFGNHLFLRLGATLVTTKDHILEVLSISSNAETTPTSLNKDEETIYNLLLTPKTKHELISTGTLTETETVSALITLELKGCIEEKYGLWKQVNRESPI